MKKVLSLIGTITLFGTSASTIVGCANNNGSSQKNDFQLSEILNGYVAPNLFLLFKSTGKPWSNIYTDYIRGELQASMANYINSYLKEHGSSDVIKDTDLRLSYLNNGEVQSSLSGYLLSLKFAADEFHRTIAIQVQKADAVALPWLSSKGATYKTSFLLDRQFRISKLFTVAKPLNLTTNYDSTLPYDESEVKNKIVKAVYRDFRINSIKAIAGQIDPGQTTLPSEYQEYRSALSSNDVEERLAVNFGDETFPKEATGLQSFLNRNLSVTASSVEVGGENLTDVLFPVVGKLENTTKPPAQKLINAQINTNAFKLAGYNPGIIHLPDTLLDKNGRVPKENKYEVFKEMNQILSARLADQFSLPPAKTISNGTDFTVLGFPFLVGSLPPSKYEQLTLSSIVTSLYLYGEGNPSTDTFQIEFDKK